MFISFTALPGNGTGSLEFTGTSTFVAQWAMTLRYVIHVGNAARFCVRLLEICRGFRPKSGLYVATELRDNLKKNSTT